MSNISALQSALSGLLAQPVDQFINTHAVCFRFVGQQDPVP